MSVGNDLAEYEYIDCDAISSIPLRPSDSIGAGHSVKNNIPKKNAASPNVQRRPRAHTPDPPTVQRRSRNHSPDPPVILPRARAHSPDPPTVVRSRNHSPDPPVILPRSRNQSPDRPAVQPRNHSHPFDLPAIRPRSRNHSPEPPTLRRRHHSTDSLDATGLQKVSTNLTKTVLTSSTKNILQPTRVAGKRSASPRRQHNNDLSTKPKLKQRPDIKGKHNTPNSSRSSSVPPTNSSSTGLPPEKGKSNVSFADGDGEILMLPDLVRRYSKSLPLRVHVEEGYCGSEEKVVISSGDIYNFHFMRSERVASIQDGSSRHFSIPFNSDIKFGLLFDPSNNFKDALYGFVFASVSDLIASKTMPKILTVVSSSQTQTGDRKSSLVEPNEVLIVKKIGKTILRKPFLKVYSLTSKEEKTLLDECEASFTTEPYQVKLYLPDLLEQFTENLPLEAMMFTPNNDVEDLPLHLTTDKIVISHTSIESVIIATTCWDLDDNDSAYVDVNSDLDDSMPISIPIEMEIQVSILSTDQDELYASTKSLLSHFDLSKVKHMKMPNESAENTVEVKTENMAEMKTCQNKLSRRIRKGYEFRGVDITMSDKVYNGQAMPFRSIINQPLPPLPQITQFQPAPQQQLTKSSPKPVKLQPAPQQLPSKSSSKLVKKTKEEIFPPLNKHVSLHPVRGLSLDGDRDVGNFKKSMAKVKSVSDDKEEPPLYNNQSPFKSLPPNFNVHMTAPTPTLGSDDDTQQRNLTKIENPSEDDVIKIGLRVNALRSLTENTMNDCRKELGDMRDEMKHLTKLVSGLRAECKFLKMSLEKVMRTTSGDSARTEPPSLPATQTTTSTMPLNQEQEIVNLKALRELSNSQIISLLEMMKLPQYKESFKEECIDGEVFVECDESILEKELGIHNRLHCTRLMKLITGRHSIHYYLSDDYDPYGRLLTLV